MSRLGMTLVELLAALTLSAMLMAVLLGMISQQSQLNKQLQAKRPFMPWQSHLRKQLQSDYAGCRHFLLKPDRIVFEGYSRFDDDKTGLATGPSSIQYYIVSSNGESLLFRERTDLMSIQPDRVTRELVCSSASQFRLESELSMDVAPGVLRMKLDLAKGKNSIQLVLVRHGGSK